MQNVKKCNRCKEEKDITCFYKDKNLKSGYKNHCKKCHVNIGAYKRWKIKNKEKLAEWRSQYRKTYFKKNPEKKIIDRKNSAKNRSERLVDAVVALNLSQKLNLPYTEVKKMKPLIEAHRQILKIKRYVRENQN